MGRLKRDIVCKLPIRRRDMIDRIQSHLKWGEGGRGDGDDGLKAIFEKRGVKAISSSLSSLKLNFSNFCTILNFADIRIF